MKILYHHRVASKDGQYVHVEELTDALGRAGHEIVMVGPAAVRKQRFGDDPTWINRLKRWMPRALYEIAELAYGVAGYHRLRRAVATHRPDVLYERYTLFLPCGVWIHRRHRLPMLLEVNAPLVHERSRHGGLALRRLARATEHHAWRGADVVLPVTRVLAGHVVRAGVPESRIVVIPNGVDPRRFAHAPTAEDAKARLGLSGRLVLGFTGFVREWHGLDRAIEFIAAQDGRRDAHLLIVGDGPDRARLQALSEKLGIGGRLTFTGAVQREAIPEHVAAFDVALQPAVVDYASPLKLFEYLALGKPVVAPSTPNIREILTDGRDAVLFDPADPDGFRCGVARLCEDDGLRTALGESARRTLHERGLTWDGNAARVIELFERLRAAVGRASERDH